MSRVQLRGWAWVWVIWIEAEEARQPGYHPKLELHLRREVLPIVALERQLLLRFPQRCRQGVNTWDGANCRDVFGHGYGERHRWVRRDRRVWVMLGVMWGRRERNARDDEMGGRRARHDM